MVEMTALQLKQGVDGSRQWTAWAAELAVIFVVILAADMALRPGIALLDISPHIFWFPVLAMAVLYGTLAAIAAAGTATFITWWYGWSVSPAEADYYSILLMAWIEPVLWLLAGIAIGAVRDRDKAARLELDSRCAVAEKQSTMIAEYAISLRSHIDVLEHRLASASPVRIDEQLQAIATCEADAIEIRVHEAGAILMDSRSAALWVASGDGWRRVWGAQELGTVTGPLARRLSSRGRPVVLPDHDISSDDVASALGASTAWQSDAIAAPVSDWRTGEPAGILLLSLSQRPASEHVVVGLASCLASVLGARLHEFEPAVAPENSTSAAWALGRAADDS